MVDFSVRTTYRAKDLASATVIRLGRLNDRLGKNVSNVNRALGELALPTTLGAGLFHTSIASADRYSQAINNLQARLGDFSGESIGQLDSLAKKLGIETVFSATQAAEAMAVLAASGLKTNNILATTPTVLDFAAATSQDLALAARQIVSAAGAFNLDTSSIEDVTRIANVLAKATVSGNVTAEEMAETFKMAAPVAKAYGLEIEELAAMVAVLGDAGIQGTVAATGLKGVFGRLASPTGVHEAILEDAGLNFSDFFKIEGGKTISKGYLEMIKSLGDSGLRAEELNRILGLEVSPKILAALIQGTDKIAETMRLVKEESGGVAKAMANIQIQGLSGQLKTFKSAFEGFQLGIIEAVPELNQALDFGTGVLRGLAADPDTLRSIAEVGMGLGALVTGLIAFRTTAMLASFALSAASPLTLGLAALAGVAYGLYRVFGDTDRALKDLSQSTNNFEDATNSLLKINETVLETGKNYLDLLNKEKEGIESVTEAEKEKALVRLQLAQNEQRAKKLELKESFKDLKSSRAKVESDLGSKLSDIAKRKPGEIEKQGVQDMFRKVYDFAPGPFSDSKATYGALPPEEFAEKLLEKSLSGEDLSAIEEEALPYAKSLLDFDNKIQSTSFNIEELGDQTRELAKLLSEITGVENVSPETKKEIADVDFKADELLGSIGNKVNFITSGNYPGSPNTSLGASNQNIDNRVSSEEINTTNVNNLISESKMNDKMNVVVNMDIRELARAVKEGVEEAKITVGGRYPRFEEGFGLRRSDKLGFD